MKTVDEVLLKAAEIIETEGWCRGALKYKGKYCAIGAIQQALGHWSSSKLSAAESQLATAAVKKVVDFAQVGLVSFNDEYAENRHDVTNLLIGAAIAGD